MRKFLFHFLIIIPCSFFLWNNTKAQDSTASHVRINSAYLLSYPKNTIRCITAPLHWKRSDCMLAGGFALSGIAFYTQDKTVQEFYQQYRTTFKDDASKYIFERLGSGTITLPLLGAFYIQGLMKKNDRSKEMALLGIQAYIVSGVLVSIPKYAFQRHRPYQDDPSQPRQWDGPMKGYTHFTSFPSGHTTAAFAMAAVFAHEYRRTELVPIIAYSLATMVGMSRIYDNKHWASDVIMGAGLGYATGKLIATHSPFKNVQGKKQASLKKQMIIE